MTDYCKLCKHDDDIGFCDKCGFTRFEKERNLPPTEYEAKPKPLTNADRIRAMTDEELAELMANKVDCQYCSVRSEWCTESEASCRANWLDWLRQEVEE
ncbi:MAG: hypothetical protein J6T17_07465 [Clostridia bacterium]|nr:hypothetical protein [Clostridia bacterium]